MEGYENPYEVVTMLVFHDVGEIRVGDIHKLANRYITVDEKRAVLEQMEPLGEIGEDIHSLWLAVEEKDSEAGRIAYDADKLEQAFMGKEFLERGYDSATDWIDAVSRLIQTDSAKSLMSELKEVSAHEWWAGLKKYS